MKSISKKLLLGLCTVALTLPATAGNKDRNGQAGATELLLNPWGASNGVFGLNGSFVKGIEAMKGNIAGLSFVESTEVGAAHSIYLRGSKVGINNAAIAQRLGDAGVLGVNIMSMGYGEIPITEYNAPGPTPTNPGEPLGTFKPQFFNVQVGFSKQFLNNVHAGVGFTFVSEQINTVRASGGCFDAGIQYNTGSRDNFHFGVALRNIGTNMRFSGSGFSGNYESPEDDRYTGSRLTPIEKFEMPSYLNISAAYDFYLDEGHLKSEDATPQHRLTVMGSFFSHSFNSDQFGGGVEYGFRELFMIRGGYRYEKNIGDKELANTFYTGFSAGATVMAPLGNNSLAFDYAFRPTIRPSSGVHTIGLRLMLRAKKTAAEETGNEGALDK